MKREDHYSALDYIKGILIFVAFIAVVGFVGAAINEYFADDEPTCADYASYGLEGSDYCTESQWVN